MSTEAEALLAWLQALPIDRVSSLSDLQSGTVLLDVLSRIDADFFLLVHAEATSESWSTRLQTLQRVYDLVLRYFTEVIKGDVSGVVSPDLEAIAKTGSEQGLLDLTSLVLVLAVQSDKGPEHIAVIQTLKEVHQAEIVEIINKHNSIIGGLQASPDLTRNSPPRFENNSFEPTFEQLKSERETLSKVYDDLLRQHNALREEQMRAINRIAELESAAEEDLPQREQAETGWRHQLEQVKGQLALAEANLSEAESTIEKHEKDAANANRRIEELSESAKEGQRLRDEIDEYRHNHEQLQKTQNTLDKYKKKLEEAADVRRQYKTLEEQHADLVDRHAKLEDDHRKAAASKSLVDQYRAQVAALEAAKAAAERQVDEARYKLHSAESSAVKAEDERRRAEEELALLNEKVAQLEGRQSQQASAAQDELGVAMSGTTMTDLNLQVRRLTRELEAERTNNSDASRVLVLENLLEDATRMKSRYQNDYLREHRAHLELSNQLEQIHSGKSGDGPEVAAALRIRLSELVEEHDVLSLRHAALQSEFSSAIKALSRAQADLSLVNKDRIDLLASLRQEVALEKTELEGEVAELQKKHRDLKDVNAMQMGQINALLVDKVGMQDLSIEQREAMLQQERAMRDLRASQGSSEESRRSKDELSASRAAADKAAQEASELRAFIRKQDRRVKELEAQVQKPFDDTEQSLRSENAMLKEEIERLKTLSSEAEERYHREQKLIVSAMHNLGMQRLVDQAASSNGRSEPKGWLGQQRARAWMKI